MLTTQEAAQREADDLDQITFTTAREFAILSYNISDFPRLHYALVGHGQTHAGIIVATQDNPRQNLHALFNLLNTMSAETLCGQLIYLNNWA